jgi:hypothetical protein
MRGHEEKESEIECKNVRNIREDTRRNIEGGRKIVREEERKNEMIGRGRE